MFPENYELRNESFLNIYLEDYNRLKEEAKKILEEAQMFKTLGDDISYMTYLKKYEAYMLTVETMIALAAKKPLADA